MQTGDIIKIIRKEKNLTQKKLGELCGIAESTIRRYELGDLKPKLETIKKIAAALEVPYTDLLDDLDMKEVENAFLSYADEIAKKRNIYEIDHRLQKLGYYISLTLDENVHISKIKADGKEVEITDEELIALEKDNDNYLKFKLIELVKSKAQK